MFLKKNKKKKEDSKNFGESLITKEEEIRTMKDDIEKSSYLKKDKKLFQKEKKVFSFKKEKQKEQSGERMEKLKEELEKREILKEKEKVENRKAEKIDSSDELKKIDKKELVERDEEKREGERRKEEQKRLEERVLNEKLKEDILEKKIRAAEERKKLREMARQGIKEEEHKEEADKKEEETIEKDIEKKPGTEIVSRMKELKGSSDIIVADTKAQEAKVFPKSIPLDKGLISQEAEKRKEEVSSEEKKSAKDEEIEDILEKKIRAAEERKKLRETTKQGIKEEEYKKEADKKEEEKIGEFAAKVGEQKIKDKKNVVEKEEKKRLEDDKIPYYSSEKKEKKNFKSIFLSIFLLLVISSFIFFIFFYERKAPIPDPPKLPDEKEISFPSVPDTPTHKECRDKKCVVVDGEGVDLCDSDKKCEPVLSPIIIDISEEIELSKLDSDVFISLLDKKFKKEYPPGTFIEIKPKYNGETLTISQLFQALDLNPPKNVKENLEEYTLYLYSQKELFVQERRNRLGIAFRMKKTKSGIVRTTMSEWEKVLPDDFYKVHTLWQRGKKASPNFLDNSYSGVKIRYTNFPVPDLSIDWAITGDILLLTTSRESIWRTIDVLKK